jgi:uncharacterized delta-60 repeat protein
MTRGRLLGAKDENSHVRGMQARRRVGAAAAAALAGTVSLASLVQACAKAHPCQETATCPIVNDDTDGSSVSEAGADGLPPLQSPPDAPFSFEPIPTPPRIVQGTSIKVPIRVVRSSPQNVDDITVTATNLPPGVTVDPLTIGRYESTGELTVKVDASVKHGPFEATVEGTAASKNANVKLPLFVRGKSGAMDTTFGTNGSVVAIGLAPQSSIGLFVDANDKVIVAAYCQDGSAVCAARLAPDGAMDATYGVGGLATIGVTDGSVSALGLDGKLTIGGNTLPPQLPITPIVGRLTAAGAPDSAFGVSGVFRVQSGSVGGEARFMRGLALAPGGAFFVAFMTVDESIGFRKYDINGADAVWGSAGYQAYKWLGFRSQLGGMAVRTNGALVFGGTYVNNEATSFGMGIAKWLPGGEMDSTQTFSSSSRSPGEFLDLPDGRALMSVQELQGGRGLIVGFSASGKTLDSGWGVAGEAAIVGRFARQADGKIAAVDLTKRPSELSRYGATSAVDGAFGTGGRVKLSQMPSGSVTHVALQADGRIIVAGATNEGANSKIVVMRIWD